MNKEKPPKCVHCELKKSTWPIWHCNNPQSDYYKLRISTSQPACKDWKDYGLYAKYLLTEPVIEKPKTTYRDKLRDPRWQKKRLEIMNRDNWSCQSCGDKETNLQVHHKSYCAGEPWDVQNHNLITYCERCHKDIEHKKK